MSTGRLIARAAIGGIFMGHGTQKLFGWFGGPGLDATGKMMEGLELRPARRNAVAASVTETAGGALLALGALTPLAGAMATGAMATAVRKVHLDKGFWNSEGGFEFNLALVAGALAIVDSGPGSPSVDESLGLELKGGKWALFALLAGLAGSAAVIEAGRRHSEESATAHAAEQGAAAAPDDEDAVERPTAQAAV
jgi:putative oxidoreductase